MGAPGSAVLGRRYVLGERIGAGGFSEVWRATDLVLARLVAIKVLHLGDAEALTRFRAEAQHAGRLSHENIARIYDYGEPAPPQPPFLVMELVDGPSLAGALAAGPLDPARCLDVVAQTASGLHMAHLAGLVHRDIKPANLLLAPGGLVKITDFGIAQAADSAPVTVTGQLLGTPGYLAPERAMGEPATSASDLYDFQLIGQSLDPAGTVPTLETINQINGGGSINDRGFVPAFPEGPRALIGVIEITDIAPPHRLQDSRKTIGMLRGH